MSQARQHPRLLRRGAFAVGIAVALFVGSAFVAAVWQVFVMGH
jgi:hypothetical protein